jgi:hypothetical protein
MPSSFYRILVRIIAGIHFTIIFSVVFFVGSTLLGITQLFPLVFFCGTIFIVVLILMILYLPRYSCYLTTIENRAREKAGMRKVRGEFLIHYAHISPKVFKTYGLCAICVLISSIVRYFLKL